MRARSILLSGAVVFALTLSGCATASSAADGTVDEADAPVASRVETRPVDAAARAQAEAWLDAANLPPGAVRSGFATGRFLSYTGWPCRPVEQLEAFWTIPNMTVADAANWLMENPTADLISTAVAPASPHVDSAIVGYIPEPDSQEGIVYTLAKADGGVAVRAEVAALTASATCPPIPGGGTYGAPGQG